MLKEIEEFNKRKNETSEDKIDIICTFCRGRVGFIRPAEIGLPLRGNMIHRHRGTESWQMPMAMHGPIDFVCPHAADPEFGDQHLFVNITEGRHDETDWLLTAENNPYRVVKVGECPCGCGGGVKEGNKYADNLRCYRRHVAQLKSEIEDG